MSRVYTDQPDHTYGPVHEATLGLSYKEKSKYKAGEFSKLKIKNYEKDGYIIDIKLKGQENNGLKLQISATRDGKKIDVDNPCYFYNAPIMVRKGTFYKETIDDLELDVPNHIENLEESLKNFVCDFVKLSDK